MSRTYTEDWQRQKSYLVRSLFYERPLLSPVPEEPDSLLEDNRHSDYEVRHRPHSPLPPLIIEREPYKHDEPEEYYTKLEIKMKRIYRKVFIEDRDFNDESNEDITNNDLSYHTEDNDDKMNEENNDIDKISSEDINNNVVSSNGYVADHESSSEKSLSNNDAESMSHNDSNTHIQHYEKSISPVGNHDKTIQNYEKSASSNGIGCKKSTENYAIEKSTETSENIECCRKSVEETRNISVGNDQNCNESKDDERIYSSEDEMDHDGEEAESGNDLNAVDDETQGNELSEGPDYMQITTKAIVHVDGTPKLTQISQVYEESESIRSLVLTTRTVKVPTDTASHPPTTQSRVTESDVMENEPIAELEEHFSPHNFSTPCENESDDSDETLEEMRSCTVIQNERQSFELNINVQQKSKTPELDDRHLSEISEESENMNPSDNNSSKTKILSDNIESILSNIINDSDNVTIRNTRKRRILQDVSIQTAGVTLWDKLCGNFFVGTPKLCRICTCIDHICC